jgi:fumarate reductase flavoprotein subunit
MAYFIKPGCSTCHFCASECPVDAIRFVGREYAIDPGKCIDCGTCAAVCPSGLISNPDEITAPIPHSPKELSCDLGVIGAGGSGLVAAVRYAQMTGKKVIVLEKAPKVGGNTNLGHGFVVRHSKLHEKAGYPDKRDEGIDQIAASGAVSKPLVRRAMYGLSDIFDWLTTFGGVEEHFKLTDMPRFGGGGVFPFPGVTALIDFPKRTQNANSTDQSMGPGWMGTFVVEKMMEQCRKLGIEILTNHRAEALLVDDSGKLYGVVASDPGGKTTLHTNCCLLASGGFSRNRELMERVRPSFYEDVPVHTFSVASCTGDAIGMVNHIGGKLDFNRVKIPMFGPTHHPFHFSLVRLAECPQAIQVHKMGRRFGNEGAPPNPGPLPLSSVMEYLPEKVAYTIFDSDALEVMGAGIVARERQNPDMERCMKPWREDLEAECKLNLAAKKADSIEELATLIGIDPNVLTDEIKKYNQFCDAGVDQDFEKEASLLHPLRKAPFYALFLSRFNEGAEGVIVNDDNLRVLKSDGTPFSGLYAVGDCCCGVLQPDDSFGKFGEMPWAMASGYIVADDIAAYTKR